jgi:predicted transcriptional regulator
MSYRYNLLRRRSIKEIAAEVLEETIKAPNLAPTRIFARAGINYSYAEILIDNALIKPEKTGKRHARLSVTEKGRTFLQHYRVCNDLLPS